MTDEIENNSAEVNAAMMEILKDRKLTAEERTQVFHNALDKLVGADKYKFQQQHDLIRAFMYEHERRHKEMKEIKEKEMEMREKRNQSNVATDYPINSKLEEK